MFTLHRAAGFKLCRTPTRFVSSHPSVNRDQNTVRFAAKERLKNLRLLQYEQGSLSHDEIERYKVQHTHICGVAEHEK
jgi:hypothetical protein